MSAKRGCAWTRQAKAVAFCQDRWQSQWTGPDLRGRKNQDKHVTDCVEKMAVQLLKISTTLKMSSIIFVSSVACENYPQN